MMLCCNAAPGTKCNNRVLINSRLPAEDLRRSYWYNLINGIPNLHDSKTSVLLKFCVLPSTRPGCPQSISQQILKAVRATTQYTTTCNRALS